MSETSRQLQDISTTEIVQEFRRALVALYPSLEKLDLMAEGSGYDESEEIEEKLWDILVVQSLKWRHGLDSAPKLPQYGLVGDASGDSAIYVYLVDGRSGRFVSFRGAIPYRGQPYSLVSFELNDNEYAEASVEEVAAFEWHSKNTPNA